jgi:hypothetical protein
MAGASESLHESPDSLSAATRDRHRALVSLQEELEAVDWYQQRADACSDSGLAGILRHNMREEMEHAAMLLEWVRREDPDFGEQLRTFLFSEGSIAGGETEGAARGGDTPGGEEATAPRATIGSLKGE